MYRICMINMPFANLARPSIALTQLRAVTEAAFPGRVSVEVVYLTHEFGQHLGFEDYTYISNSMDALYAGLGDWFFRAVAFPELPDNTDRYLRRFYSQRTAQAERIRTLAARTRPALAEFCESLIARYALDRADMVGFTSMFMQNGASFAMARLLKRRNPRTVTVLGGANCEFPMGQVIARRVPDIDFVFSGPALKNFPQFIGQCLDTGPPRAVPRGVFTRETPADVPLTEAYGEELSIDVPIPLDYDDFFQRCDRGFPAGQIKPVLPLETSRGCWWGQVSHCTFCGLNGATMNYRAMAPAHAIEQFKAAFRHEGRVGMVEAVDNILPRTYIDQVLPYLATPEGMQIFYEVKADLSRQDMAVLAKANVNVIQPGIESLATSTLKLMKKGTSAAQNITFLRNCVSIGIKPVWNLLIGFPGERSEVYRRYTEILPHLMHLAPPQGVFPVRFDRFSPYHRQAAAYGLELHPMDFYSYVYPFDAADLEAFAYYFADHNTDAAYIRDMADWLQPLRGLVAAWNARWSGRAPGSPVPVLRPGDTPDVIYDSRDGTVREHHIGALGAAMLQHAVKPVRLEELLRRFTPSHGSEAAGTLARLDAAGLLFREGDRLLSLVIGADEETPGVPAEVAAGVPAGVPATVSAGAAHPLHIFMPPRGARQEA